MDTGGNGAGAGHNPQRGLLPDELFKKQLTLGVVLWCVADTWQTAKPMLLNGTITNIHNKV